MTCGTLPLLIAAFALSVPSAQARKVLVLGGTGLLGTRIVRLLVEDGRQVTVFVRPTSGRSPLHDLPVDYVVGDLMNEADVMTAIETAKPELIIVAVSSAFRNETFYETISRNIVKAAKASPVQQIIHHGAVGAGDNMDLHPQVPWDSVPGVVRRMHDHGLAEQNLLSSGLNVTIIRNSRVWPDDTPATGRATLTEDQRTLTPITRADLAELTLQCVDNPACNGKIYHAKDDSLGWPPP